MKTTNSYHHNNAYIKSPSPNNNTRYRSREKDIEEEKVKNPAYNNYNNNIFTNHTHPHSFKNQNKEEGKLYLANIPINIPQTQIKEEFEKYGHILDYSFRKKTDIPNPYYYGYITLSQKSEAEEAMNNITQNLSWTVMPFHRDTKEKNVKNRGINNHLNNYSNCKNNSHEDKDNLSSDYENNNLNNKLINFIKVREIWVKNLPLSVNEAALYKEFFIYGEISKIELKTSLNENSKFAFIKYRLMSSAIKAYEKENNIYFYGNIINVSFSNPATKKDIIGNEVGYELTVNNCKLIVVCLNKNVPVTDEATAVEIFENFGKVKNIKIKNISNINHIFVEFYKCEDAKKAIEEMNKDINYEKRKILGDDKCEINFYFKNKLNEINPISINDKNININTNTNSNPIINSNVCLPQNNNMNNNLLVNNLMGQNLLSKGKGINFGNNNISLISQLLQNKLLNNNQFNLNKLNNNINNNLQNKCQQNLINQFQCKNINANTNNNTMPLNNINVSNSLNNILNNNTLLSKTSFPFIQPYMNPNIQNIKNNNFMQNQNLQNLQNFSKNGNINLNQLSISLLLNNPCISNLINNSVKNFINLNPNIKKNINNNNNSNNNNVNMNNNPNNNNSNKNNNKAINNNNNNNNISNDVKDLLNKIMLDKENKKLNNNSDSDISSLNGSQSAEEMDFDREYSLEEENLKYIWNGILTKNNKDRVSIDIFKIRGNIDDTFFKGFHLNICNRIQYEEVMKKHLLGIVAISPQNVTQKETFDLYVNYLNERQRCGVINLSEQSVLYLSSPGEFSNKFYINPKKHLLGLLVDATVEPALYVDMNNLALPPPVISMTEKRRIMNKNKKHEHSSNNNSEHRENNTIAKLKEQLKQKDKDKDNNEENENEKLKNINELIKNNPKIKEIMEKLSKNNANEY